MLGGWLAQPAQAAERADHELPALAADQDVMRTWAGPPDDDLDKSALFGVEALTRHGRLLTSERSAGQ